MKKQPRFFISFGFACKCGNNCPEHFYFVPAEVLRADLTFGFSENIFRIICKFCKAEHRVDVQIRAIDGEEPKAQEASTEEGYLEKERKLYEDADEDLDP